MIKNPKHLDYMLTNLLHARCTGTGAVYRYAVSGGYSIVGEFCDADVAIKITASDWERDIMGAIDQLLIAHGEIKVPGQL